METSRFTGQVRAAVAISATALVMTACVVRPVEKPAETTTPIKFTTMPLFVDKDVDILFVIDNSGSMGEEQANLRKQFPRLIEALKSEKLGGKLPNVRIGVVSSDLGAGNMYVDNACVTDGDKGKLQSKAMIAGCTPPKDPWIAYSDDSGMVTTNIPGAGDPIQKVKNAFSCIASIGTDGCGFEQTIMSAKKALDSNANINPGFLRNGDACKSDREDALLAVVFITDEDDCSAANPQLFDPSQQGLNDPLGPLTSFRCFEFGVKCTCPGKAQCDRFTQGPRTNCVPGGQYLHKMENFVSFWKNLKKMPQVDSGTGKCTSVPNPDRVIMAAIAGSTNRVEVGMSGNYPTLKPGCTSSQGDAAPAVRIKSLVRAFAKQLTVKQVADIKAKKVNIPHFVEMTKDGKEIYREDNFTSICNSDFSPALQRLGDRIVGSLGTLCFSPPALTNKGGILCRKGDVICDAATCGKKVVCEQGCLESANLSVTERSATSRRTIERCSAKLFDPKLKSSECAGECPCWRMVPAAVCSSKQAGSSPYALEIMRQGTAPKGTYATVGNVASPYAWGSQEFSKLKQCN